MVGLEPTIAVKQYDFTMQLVAVMIH